MTALNPVQTIGAQVMETILIHGAMSAEKAEHRAREVLTRVGLPPERFPLSRYPHELSGGQRQRVAIGRSIVREPKVFLFDEPLSNLDAELRVQMRLEIAKLHNDLDSTMIYVTHDQTEAMTLADKIVVLRAGRVEQFGSPLELYDNPDNDFVAGFIGSPRMNFLDAEVTSSKKGSAMVVVPSLGNIKFSVPTRDRTPEKGEAVKVGIRPEHFIAASGAKHKFKAPTTVVEQLGGVSYLYLDVGQELPLTVEQKGHTKLDDGDVATIGVDPTTTMVFGKDGLRI
ncbi:unnamed protein product [Cyprideis torosa]|uniref:Uncharacterized protein n=1 Tax=Cyprideis torosa TaxID=163714 RepID=A0A7R8WUW2_9CRUS|nr:unnamed protein product [Cyprideis torosa]CAG0909355.1 unnamed protein product [Cyprideis torosa]